MDSINLSKDKHGRTLAVINTQAAVIIDSRTKEYYMVVLVVDLNDEVAKDHFVQYVRECSNGKVFMVAVFAADQDRKTVDPALLSGIDSWFVTSSQKQAVEIANGMQQMATSEGQISLDLADMKTILYHRGGCRAYYGKGVSGDKLNAALDNALLQSKENGLDKDACSRYLMAISCDTDLIKAQIDDFNDFCVSLSAKHDNDFEMKWGLTSPTDSTNNAISVTLIATHSYTL